MSASLLVIPPLSFAWTACVVVLITNDFSIVFILPLLTWFICFSVRVVCDFLLCPLCSCMILFLLLLLLLE